MAAAARTSVAIRQKVSFRLILRRSMISSALGAMGVLASCSADWFYRNPDASETDQDRFDG
jgi:hypothetical protein